MGPPYMGLPLRFANMGIPSTGSLQVSTPSVWPVSAPCSGPEGLSTWQRRASSQNIEHFQVNTLGASST